VNTAVALPPTALSAEAAAAATTRLDAQTSAVMLHLQGLHCRACVARLEKALGRSAQASVDIPSGTCELRWNPRQADLTQLLERVRDARLTPTLMAPDSHYEDVRQEQRTSLIRIGVAALLGMQVMMLATTEYFTEVDAAFLPLLRYAQWFLATPVLLYAGWPMLVAGLSGLWNRALVMDTPVAIALIGAYGLSGYHTVTGTGQVYFDSVGMFVFLLLLARHWQARGQVLAADRLRRLVSAQPLTAQRETAGQLEVVPVAGLQPGDIIVVAPGAALPADGSLLDAVELDESLLTGEALPQGRQIGEKVLAGCVNLDQRSVRLTVQTAGEKTVLSQIARLVQQAHLQRSRVMSLADRVARWLVPGVLLTALAALMYWMPDTTRATQAALAVLVITCPCALSLAVPTSLAAAVTRMGKQGVLLVRPEALQRMAQITDVVFDKTGTLTTRDMQIDSVECAPGVDEGHARDMAARLEAGLEHPIARAFRGSQKFIPPEGREVIPGQGVFATIENRSWSLLPLPADATAGRSAERRWFQLMVDASEYAVFGLREQLRDGAQDIAEGLRGRGLTVHLLSGDQQAATRAIAQQLGIRAVDAGQHPDDKLAYVRSLQQQGRGVLMVGDGMNDGPVLAGADVSLSLGSGAALAQAQGDAILMGDDLRGLLGMFAVAQQTRRVIVQNISWALGYNLTLVPVAFMGFILPWVAAIGMGASSLLVTLNALRLVRVAPQTTEGVA